MLKACPHVSVRLCQTRHTFVPRVRRRVDQTGDVMGLMPSIYVPSCVLCRASPPTLAYMCTVVNSTIGFQLPAKETRPLYTYFYDKVATMTTAEPGYATTYQTASAYLWMRLEELLLDNALFAMVISLVIAFLIVWVSTRDIGLSLLSTFTIFGIVLTLMATLVWMGWDISVIESICLTILVGLSVDYTIHLANSWQTSSSHKHRCGFHSTRT